MSQNQNNIDPEYEECIDEVPIVTPKTSTVTNIFTAVQNTKTVKGSSPTYFTQYEKSPHIYDSPEYKCHSLNTFDLNERMKEMITARNLQPNKSTTRVISKNLTTSTNSSPFSKFYLNQQSSTSQKQNKIANEEVQEVEFIGNSIDFQLSGSAQSRNEFNTNSDFLQVSSSNNNPAAFTITQSELQKQLSMLKMQKDDKEIQTEMHINDNTNKQSLNQTPLNYDKLNKKQLIGLLEVITNELKQQEQTNNQQAYTVGNLENTLQNYIVKIKSLASINSDLQYHILNTIEQYENFNNDTQSILSQSLNQINKSIEMMDITNLNEMKRISHFKQLQDQLMNSQKSDRELILEVCTFINDNVHSNSSLLDERQELRNEMKQFIDQLTPDILKQEFKQEIFQVEEIKEQVVSISSAQKSIENELLQQLQNEIFKLNKEKIESMKDIYKNKIKGKENIQREILSKLNRSKSQDNFNINGQTTTNNDRYIGHLETQLNQLLRSDINKMSKDRLQHTKGMMEVFKMIPYFNDNNLLQKSYNKVIQLLKQKKKQETSISITQQRNLSENESLPIENLINRFLSNQEESLKHLDLKFIRSVIETKPFQNYLSSQLNLLESQMTINQQLSQVQSLLDFTQDLDSFKSKCIDKQVTLESNAVLKQIVFEMKRLLTKIDCQQIQITLSDYSKLLRRTQSFSPDYVLRCVINNSKCEDEVSIMQAKHKDMQHELDEWKYKHEMLITDLQMMENKYYDLLGKQQKVQSLKFVR